MLDQLYSSPSQVQLIVNRNEMIERRKIKSDTWYTFAYACCIHSTIADIIVYNCALSLEDLVSNHFSSQPTSSLSECTFSTAELIVEYTDTDTRMHNTHTYRHRRILWGHM